MTDPDLCVFQLLCLSLLVAVASARTVRVRPVSAPLDQDTRQAEYYAEQPDDDDAPILVSRQDTYGRATGQARVNPRFKPEAAKQPPVQTIRNYNKLNDDGSFTFGYEAADGSFKEETRGTDCVVRGKYGYVDPDGNKREFTYVSGNPCDPNAINQEQEEDERPLLENGEENIPANVPIRRPVRPRPQPNPTTHFQQNYNAVSSQEEEEDENVPIRIPARQPARARPVTTTYRPSFAQSTVDAEPVYRPTPAPTPKAVFIPQPTPRQPPQAVRITPRPSTVEPATTYRPQHLEVTASPSPAPTRSFPKPRPTQSSTALDFDDEFKKFQLENNVVSTTSKPLKGVTSEPIYSTELVFDPSSGQYNTVLYQSLPQTVGGEVNLRGRLQPYVDTSFPPNPFLPPQRAVPYQQQLFQQNQAQLLQQSQQLFAQQQKRQKPVASAARLEDSRQVSQNGFPSSLLQQEPQTFQAQSTRQAFAPQPFYYVNPEAGPNTLAAGQIDAFLRGHSLTV